MDRFVILFVLYFSIAARCSSATITAASVALNDVIAALALAGTGDTVQIPSGTSEWSSNLVISNAITLQGAGTNATFITNSYASTGNLITVLLTASETNRFKDITFVHLSKGKNQTIFASGSNTDGSRLIVNNCAFYDSPMLRLVNVLGVAYSNYLVFSAGGNNLAHIKNSSWNGHSNGAGAWTNDTPLFGSDNFFYFENNLLVCTNDASLGSLIDAQAGGRYVFRFNTVTNGYVEGHGSEAQYERSTHAVEVYGNTFDQKNINSYVTYYRGGNGLVFSNRIYNVTANACLHIIDNRVYGAAFQPYGIADGRNPWDVNDGANPFVTGAATSAGGASTQTVTDSSKSWTTDQWRGYIVRRTSGKAVSSLTRSGATIEVTCTGHGFTNNALVSIFGANEQPYNALYAITVVDANTFTASVGEARPSSPATGTILAAHGAYASVITANTSDTLTFSASIYVSGVRGTDYNLQFSSSDTFEINKITHLMDSVGRTGGGLVDASATPALPSGWNNQVTYAFRQWANDLGGVSATFSASPVFTDGTHYISGTPLPGYTPYTYPHPLISGVSDGGSSSSATRPPRLRGIRLSPR